MWKHITSLLKMYLEQFMWYETEHNKTWLKLAKALL